MQKFGSHVCGPYILDDSYSENDSEVNGDKVVIKIGLIGTMEEVMLPLYKVRAFDEGHKHGKIC